MALPHGTHRPHTVHLTAQQSLIQAVCGCLLHPLLHRGSIDANVVLQEGWMESSWGAVMEGWGVTLGSAHLAVRVAQRSLHGTAVAVQQLPCILDGFGDGIALAQES